MNPRSSFPMVLNLLGIGLAVVTSVAYGQGREVPTGRYECWFDGRARMGLNFRILPGGRYADVEDKPGTYSFVAAEELVFRGAALDGQHAQHKAGSRIVTFISPRRVLLASCDLVK